VVNNNNNNGFRVRFGVRRRNRGPKRWLSLYPGCCKMFHSNTVVLDILLDV